MRLLAVGDVHGCYRALSTLVEAVRLSPEDLLVTLGDYVDRGPDTYAVLDWLIHQSQVGRLIPLRGNHELMMLAARDEPHTFANWCACGGDATLASYSTLDDEGQLSDVPDSHWSFIERQCVDWHETERHLFVHANAYPDYPLEEQPDYVLFWEFINEWTPAHESGKTMICGHTPQRSGVPLNLGHAVCIDTAACKGGWLTCLDVNTERYWQANEAGDVREADLAEPNFR